jgi:hypothetical protein
MKKRMKKDEGKVPLHVVNKRSIGEEYDVISKANPIVNFLYCSNKYYVLGLDMVI